MAIGLFAFRSWLARQTLFYWIFTLVVSLGSVLLISSILFGVPILSRTDQATLFSGLLAGGVVWWQGHLITRHMVLSAVTDLNKEWNSKEMLDRRQAAWTKDGPNPVTIEAVLEFLEKVSTLEKNRFVTRQLIWDTFGWYMGRYYFYCKNVIDELRLNWTPKGGVNPFRGTNF